MQLELTPDQELFTATTKRFIETEASIANVRANVGSPFAPATWRAGAELGWTAMLVPESLGGGSISGSGLRDLVLVAEEMGKVVAGAPLVSVSVVLDALTRVATADQRSAIIPSLLSGESIAAWAIDEGIGSWDAATIATRAVRAGEGWVLSGTKRFVQDGAEADWLLVSTRTDEGLSQFIVRRDAPGVAVTARTSLDLSRQLCDITFADVTVGADALVGAVGGAAPDIERQLQIAVALQNAETVGALDTVFAFTLDYANDRVAFGRPLSSYQALKHRFADMKMWLEACHATATASTDAVADARVDASELTSVAKSYIGARSVAMVQDCIQLHGGIGVTWEHDLHIYLRRVTQNATLFGAVRHHRERIAKLIGNDL